MSGLLPRTFDESALDHDPGPLTLALDDPATETLFATLDCRGGKQILRALQAKPLTPARIARRVETSLQNVSHHVSQLEAAGLIEPVGVDVSERGREMTVYAPAGDPILVTVDGTIADVDAGETESPTVAIDSLRDR